MKGNAIPLPRPPLLPVPSELSRRRRNWRGPGVGGARLLVVGGGKVADMSQDMPATLILPTDTVRALRPCLHEVRHVHTAQAGGEVPALLSRIGGLFFFVRRRHNTENIGIGKETAGV